MLHTGWYRAYTVHPRLCKLSHPSCDITLGTNLLFITGKIQESIMGSPDTGGNKSDLIRKAVASLKPESPSSETGGVRPMYIVGRMESERERCIGMTDEERQWRAQWLKDQILAPDEPIVPPNYYKERFNPIRRFYRAPLNALERMITPIVGPSAAIITRNSLGKIGLVVFAIYCGHYYLKYNRMNWQHSSGWHVIASRKMVCPGDPDYPNAPIHTQEIPLSAGEKTFILHGVDADFRNDGRRRCEYRAMEVETKLMPQTHGSARLRIGNTDVLVGVKVELDSPLAEKPDEGKLEFFVDCSANATPAFEGKGGDNLATEISNILTIAYQTRDAIDLRKLCILPHQKCWKIYVDILILQCSGNLFDAIGAAVKAALYNTEIPRVTAAFLDGGEPDIQLSDDPYDCIKLDTKNYPVIITLCKIGDKYVVDATLEEEMCSAVSIVMGILPNGNTSAVVKLGYGSILPTTFINMLKMGQDVGLKLNEGLMKTLKEEEKLGHQRPIFGFLR
ncbi:hypothetical protein KM043_010299 [Ampulex compressa]|nr:hypothetical protein KM043_010299 [Ampulex compressa]